MLKLVDKYMLWSLVELAISATIYPFHWGNSMSNEENKNKNKKQNLR